MFNWLKLEKKKDQANAQLESDMNAINVRHFYNDLRNDYPDSVIEIMMNAILNNTSEIHTDCGKVITRTKSTYTIRKV